MCKMCEVFADEMGLTTLPESSFIILCADDPVAIEDTVKQITAASPESNVRYRLYASKNPTFISSTEGKDSLLMLSTLPDFTIEWPKSREELVERNTTPEQVEEVKSLLEFARLIGEWDFTSSATKFSGSATKFSAPLTHPNTRYTRSEFQKKVEDN